MPLIDPLTWAAVMAHENTLLNPPSKPEMISAFQTKHGVVLPASHREFLARGNGGCVGFIRLFGIGCPDGLDLDLEVSEMRSELESMADGPVFPFSNNWGGSYFCYDLRVPLGHDYPVLLWNHEYSEEPEWRPMLWQKYATNFNHFLRRVSSESGDEPYPSCE